MNRDSIAIVDCHVHFVDVRSHRYPIFQQRSAALESVVGDYSALPRRYLPEDYLQEVGECNVVKTVWAEFMSDDPVKEASWAQALSNESGHPHGLIAQADFLSSEVVRVIDSYGCLPRVRAVRQHLAFEPSGDVPTGQLDLLDDNAWRERLALLCKNDLRCELEILAPRLRGFANVAGFYPDMQFVLPLMGWPMDLTDTGHQAWKSGMRALSGCKNVAVKIFGMECIFGLEWTIEQVRPWILDTIDLFGPERCMFASHMPIGRLSRGFQDIYAAYFEVVSDFSASDKQRLFHDTATKVYKV
jgi:predicted TIM-barrel fold metal-dependent hydrolase